MACRSATYRKPAIDGAPPAPRLAALYGRQGECGALAEPRRSRARAAVAALGRLRLYRRGRGQMRRRLSELAPKQSLVPPTGLEPVPSAPEADTLSAELRGPATRSYPEARLAASDLATLDGV